MGYLKNRAVFLDRDGVVNRKAVEGSYIHNWTEIQFIPGSIEAIAQLNSAGFRVFIVTNQRGIARGLVRQFDLEEIHRFMKEKLSTSGAEISGFYYCPHDYSDRCNCRKPMPGMLLRAAEENELDITTCWMIGDSESDIEAGRRAGCRTIRIADCLVTTVNTVASACARDLLSAAQIVISTSLLH